VGPVWVLLRDERRGVVVFLVVIARLGCLAKSFTLLYCSPGDLCGLRVVVLGRPGKHLWGMRRKTCRPGPSTHSLFTSRPWWVGQAPTRLSLAQLLVLRGVA